MTVPHELNKRLTPADVLHHMETETPVLVVTAPETLADMPIGLVLTMARFELIRAADGMDAVNLAAFHKHLTRDNGQE